MYCVNCGVKLQDEVDKCPLCSIPVWKPEELEKFEEKFPKGMYPVKRRAGRITVVSFITVILLAVCLSCFIACMTTIGKIGWSSYVILGIIAMYVIAVLPFWFSRNHPFVFVPVDFGVICVYLLFVCLSTGGKWFLSFAFPVVMIVGILVTGSLAIFKFVKVKKLLVIGSMMILIGLSNILVELFAHITFGSAMFVWSLYPVAAFGLLGLFLIIADLIHPLRAYLERKFFV